MTNKQIFNLYQELIAYGWKPCIYDNKVQIPIVLSFLSLSNTYLYSDTRDIVLYIVERGLYICAKDITKYILSYVNDVSLEYPILYGLLDGEKVFAVNVAA